MTTITLEKAQADLPALLKRALEGEEIVVELDGKLVRLAPLAAEPRFDEERARQRGWGCLKGQFEVTDAFFEPLPEDELKLWEGRGDE